MKIRDLNIDGNIFLAPMAGVTDMPFRTICYEKGCSFAYTEMISAKGLYYNDTKTKELMYRGKDEPYLGVQIFGSEPIIMEHAIEYINKQNVDLIDINMGCPTPKIIKNNDGSALLKQPKLVEQIVKACVRVSAMPITVKIRLGFELDSINVLEISKIIEQSGADAITIHGRTSKMYYSGKANWEYIKQVKENISIPVIGNGDITNYNEYVSAIKNTNCDGVMIGRAAQGNPWVFEDINNKKRNIAIDEKIKTIIRHYELLVDYKGEKRATLEMRKHIAWYIRGDKYATKVKRDVFKAETIDQMKEAIELIR